MSNKTVTIILPVHKLNDDYNLMLENAIKSVEPFYVDAKLLIVYPQTLNQEMIKVLEKIEKNKLEIECHYHYNSSDFVSQVNFGINNCKTEWFSILEVDDEYKPIWLKSMFEYVKEYPEVDVFLPIVKDINTKGEFLSFTNESLWAYGFTDKQGVLDHNVLLEFQNFQTSGALYKTNVIKENGLFKDNIKLVFGLEFLLRLTSKNVQIMTVPRIGYQHVNFREDSLFWLYKHDEKMKLNEKEVKFWIDTAKKEFFYVNKRDINYVES